MKKNLLIALCSLSSLYVNAQLCLSPATNYGTSANPYNVCTADFNGDGKLDLATANSFGNDVSVLLNTGTGTFGTSTSFSISTVHYPGGICAGDFNGDTKIDIAATFAFGGQNKIAIILGNGNGTFGAATTFTVSAAGPNSIVTADFNADGKLDLATANYNASNASVLFGNGNGTFGAATNYSTTSSSPNQIIVADFNADGKPDFATANETSLGNVSIFINQGAGVFGPGTIYSSGTTVYGLCAGDFNGDAKLDIASTNFGDGTVAILIGNGTGGFAAPVAFSVGTSPVAISCADLDGDSKLDVAVTNYNGTPQLFVMLGDGAGNLGTPVGYTVGSNPYFVIAADLDGNGKKDVVTSNYNSNNVSVLLNGPPTVTISGSLAICSGNGTTLSGTSAETYTWSSGGNSSTTFVSPAVGTTTYTLTEANGTCTATAVATVTVTSTPTLSIIGNTNICSGSSTILTGGTAANYTWMPGGANTNTVSANPSSTATYTLTGANGACTSSITTTVNVTPTPTVIITGTQAICSGQSTILTGSSAGTYTWSANASSVHTVTASVNPGSTATYTLTEANGTCTASGVATVSVTPTPTLSISGAQNICSGNSAVLTAATATNYTWSANAGSVHTNTASIAPTTLTMYTVTGGNPLLGGSGECVSTATMLINSVQPAVPSICMVSSDSMSLNNIIYWDKTGFTNMDSFIIYREVSTNIYKRIGAVKKDSLSRFIDVNRSVGPANGDPNIGFYRYKLQLRDTCGNYSALSPYHTSVYFVDNHTGTFTWNTYIVEGSATPVANFILRRDNANNGIYVVVGNVSGNTTTLNDPNYSTYQSIANWRIDATGFNCTPTFRYGNNGTQTAIVKSKSNITNNRSTGVQSVSKNMVAVYPNPASGVITIETAVFQNSVVEIYNMVGQKITAQNLSGESTQVNISNLSNGVYELRVMTNGNTILFQNKIVKQD